VYSDGNHAGRKLGDEVKQPRKRYVEPCVFTVGGYLAAYLAHRAYRQNPEWQVSARECSEGHAEPAHAVEVHEPGMDVSAWQAVQG
jgi:hypothetical protein